MTYRIASIATTLSDGAGIATRRILESLEPNLESIVQFVANSSPNDPDYTYTAGRIYPSLAMRLKSRLTSKLFPDSDFSARLQILHQRYALKYELFSHPFSSEYDQCFLNEHLVDLVHLHWISGFVDFPSFFQACSLPIVWTLHDQFPYLGGFHYQYDLDRNPEISSLEAECFAIKQTSLRSTKLAVIGNSEWNTNEARNSGMFPRSTYFQTIYYPLDTVAISPRNKKSSRLVLNLDPQSIYIGFAATDVGNSRKGFSVLIDALNLLSATGLRFSLLTFGRRPSLASTSEWRLPWHHFGFVDDDRLKSIIFSAMTCFVVPSLAEAFGQTAIEAMACETVVIASNVGGLAEAVGTSGILFEPGNSLQLFHSLQALLGHEPSLADLGREARASVVLRHDPARCAKQYLNVYETLLSQNG